MEECEKNRQCVEMIKVAADEISADLIVMATQGHQGFLDAVLRFRLRKN